MQFDQFRARVHAQFVVQLPAQILVAVEGFGLPSAPRSRPQLGRTQPFADGMRGD
nr:hypothetical protein [Saccharopolyspora pogona]